MLLHGFFLTLQSLGLFNNLIVQNSLYLWYLQNWNGQMTLSSIQPSIFENYYLTLKGYYTLTDDPLYFVNLVNSTTNFTLLSQLFDKSINTLFTLFGGVPAWGSIHYSYFPHLVLSQTSLDCFASRSINNIGGFETVNVGSPDINYRNTQGASYREILDFSNLNSSYFIVPPGQDGNILSYYYGNLLQMWRDGQYIQTNGLN